MPNRTAEVTLESFMKLWIQPFGPPTLLILDRGKEFDNFRFQQMVGGLGVGLHYIDTQSPWQNARTEKAGGLLKEKLAATVKETTATVEELPVALAEVVSTRNRYLDRYGFSPMQGVFGRNLRLPASLLSTDALNADLVEASAPDPIRRTWEIRDTAAAWLRRQDVNAIKRGWRGQTRTADAKPISPGSWVYVHRDTPTYKGWVGPGVLIAEDNNHRSGWVSTRGRLWKASREQLRLATPEEELGAELVVELSKHTLAKLSKADHVAYQDVSQEGGPQDDDDDDDDDGPGPDEFRQVFRVREPDPGMVSSEHQPSTGEPDDLDMQSEEQTTAVPPTEGQSRRVSFLEPQEEERQPMTGIEEETASPTAGDNPEPSPAASRTSVRVDEGAHGTLTFGPVRSRETPSRGPFPHVPETPPVGYRPGAMPYPMDRRLRPLPLPPERSTFLEVIDFDLDEDLRQFGTREPFVGANWKHCREQGRPVLQPRLHSTGKPFTASYAEASFCYRDKCHYVSKAKASFGQVEFTKLDEERKKVFRAARKKELDSLVSNGAVKILSLEESRRFEEEFPEQVIDSKFVDRFKLKDITHDTIEEYKRRAIQEGHLDICELEEDQQSPKIPSLRGWLAGSSDP